MPGGAPRGISTTCKIGSRHRRFELLLLAMLASASELLVLARSIKHTPYRHATTTAFAPSESRCQHTPYRHATTAAFATRRHYCTSRPSFYVKSSICVDRSPLPLSIHQLGGRQQFLQEGLSMTGDDSENNPQKLKPYDRPKKKKKKPKVQLYRADRVLANRSGKTRSECFKLLTKYAVSIVEEDDDDDKKKSTADTDISQVKFRRINGPKERIPMTARLFINQKFEVPALPPLLTVFHKPKWTLSTMGDDPKGRRNLQGLSFPHVQRMHPVGRLDYDTNGLLLFSSSGPLTQTLLHPKYEKEKEYVAVVAGKVEKDELQSKLEAGVELADVSRAAKQEQKVNPSERKQTFVTRAEIQDVQHLPASDVPSYLEDIRNNLPKEYNVTDLNLRGYLDIFKATELSEVRLIVKEGKHRMVRRMLASCGHPVVSLKRERMGIIELGDLKEGSFRNLTAQEEEWARSLVPKSD